MHIPRSDRSLEFIARGCSLGTILLHIPVILLIILIGLAIANPFIAGSTCLWLIHIARTLGLQPGTLLLLSAVVPVLHALLQHSNRRHGIGGGRWILYTGVYLAPVAFAMLYYIGLQQLLITTPNEYYLFPCAPSLAG